MDSFTPLPATIGGLLIGLAAAVLWLGNGRIAGITGLFGNLLPPAGPVAWRITFLFALVAGTAGAAALLPGLGGGPGALVAAPVWFAPGTAAWLVLAGLLTGIGTRISNGCTSGHGVCGLARLSPRSMVAVGVFFSVAMLTVALTGVA